MIIGDMWGTDWPGLKKQEGEGAPLCLDKGGHPSDGES